MIRKSPRVKKGSKRNKSNYGVCDICSRVVYASELKRTYGTRGKLWVCPEDFENPHPQDKPRVVKEKIPHRQNPLINETKQRVTSDTISTGGATYSSGSNPNPPTNIQVTPQSSTSIELMWIPGSPGSSAVKGYKIERESPVGGGFATVKADTGSGASYYLDTGLSANTVYNYRISAINYHGTGTASAEASGTTKTA